jgi:hypothetical protein
MTDEDLKAAIYSKPFEPVRLKLTNGESYEIRHPGSIAIGAFASSIVVNGRLHQIVNAHIVQIEPLELATT